MFAEAKLGIDCETFMASDVGRYLVGRATAEIEAARDELEEFNSSDAAGVRAIQNRIWRAKSVLQWLEDAVQNGRAAEHQLLDNNR